MWYNGNEFIIISNDKMKYAIMISTPQIEKESQSKFYVVPRNKESDQQQLSWRLFGVISRLALMKSPVNPEGVIALRQTQETPRPKKLQFLTEWKLWEWNTRRSDKLPDKIQNLSSSYCWNISTLWEIILKLLPIPVAAAYLRPSAS